jgi:hypothetical protein
VLGAPDEAPTNALGRRVVVGVEVERLSLHFCAEDLELDTELAQHNLAVRTDHGVAAAVPRTSRRGRADLTFCLYVVRGTGQPCRPSTR